MLRNKGYVTHAVGDLSKGAESGANPKIAPPMFGLVALPVDFMSDL